MSSRALLSSATAIAACAFPLLFAACDDATPKGGAASSAAPTSAAPAATTADPNKPKAMPEVLVDAEGPYIGGARVDLVANGGRDKLTKLVKDLPINGQTVTLIAEKRAKIPDVAAVVVELGAAGAPKITIKTDGRNDLPKEITVTPEARVSNPPGCSITAIVMKDDLATAVWPYKGGRGIRTHKGLAGPDLSHTGEALEKELAACDSTMAFFSSDDPVGWEAAYNLAGTILVSDKKKKIDTLVLLHEAPVAGRPIGSK